MDWLQPIVSGQSAGKTSVEGSEMAAPVWITDERKKRFADTPIVISTVYDDCEHNASQAGNAAEITEAFESLRSSMRAQFQTTILKPQAGNWSVRYNHTALAI